MVFLSFFSVLIHFCDIYLDKLVPLFFYEQGLMDARMQIEREIETKTKSSLKEGLGQQLKIVRTRSFFCVFDLTPSFLHSLFWISSSFSFFSHRII